MKKINLILLVLFTVFVVVSSSFADGITIQSRGAKKGVNDDITSMTGLDNDGIPLAKVANAASDGANSDITSITGLDGSNLNISGGYVIGDQGSVSALNNTPAYWLDGVDDFISTPSTALSAFGAKDFSILAAFRITSKDGSIFSKRASDDDAAKGFALYVNASGILRTLVYDPTGIAIGNIGTTDVTDGEEKIVVATYNRDGNAIGYVNGNQEATIDISGHPATITVAGTGYIGRSQSNTPAYSAGIFNTLSLLNFVLTPVDAIKLSSGYAIPKKWEKGSNVELTSNPLVIGYEYIIDTFNAGDDFSNVGGTNETGNIFTATGATATTWANSSILRHLGVMMKLEGGGVGHTQWTDNSGHEIETTVSGALPINLPPNHREKYVDLLVTGNTSFTLPQGYKITSIIVHNTTANALTGGLDVGLTTNGVEIVSAEAIGANAEVVCTLIQSGTIGGTFTTADDIIYFSDGDDDTNWNSASLEITVSMERIALN